MKTFIIVVSFLILFQISECQDQNAIITIDSRNIVGKLNPWVFGNNILAYQKGMFKYASQEYWNRGGGVWDPDSQHSVSEMVELAKLSGMSVVRYPGAQHYYNWKRTVGPKSKRPDQQFGLPEFLQFCSDIGAIPLITIPEYSGTAQDAADLVEYLNASYDGKHTWAAQRVKDGHSSPWNVVWFEYGNETDPMKMSASAYSQNYLAYLSAMKEIDPNIKLGIVGTNEFPSLNDWFRNVLEIIAAKADFIIHHAYIPSYSRNDNTPNSKELFSISLSCEAQIQSYYEEMNKMVYELTGKHIPIAVTEYNGLFLQEKPVEYRLSLGNALLNAEMIKVFLNPKNNIIMANSWQFCNESWGAVKGYTYKHEPLVKRPLYYVFEMYHNHFGEELITSDVSCNTYDTDGGFGVIASKGSGQEYYLYPEDIPLATSWDLMNGINFSQHLENGTLAVEFKGADVNYYHARLMTQVEKSFGYHISAWIKTENLTSGVCMEVIDANRSALASPATSSASVIGTNDWRKVEVDYIPTSNQNKIEIRARRISGTGNITGRAFFRDVKVQKYLPRIYRSVPYLSVNTSYSSSKNSKIIYCMVVNKNMNESIKAKISILGFQPQRAKVWILNAPSVDATNEENPENVKISKYNYGTVKNGFVVDFPPHSMTALEVE